MNRLTIAVLLPLAVACGGEVAVTKVDSEVGVSPELGHKDRAEKEGHQELGKLLD